MSKKLLIVVVAVVVVVAAAGYWYLESAKLTPEEQALKDMEDAARALTESATQGVLDLGATPNPVGEVTDVNPVDKANPFSGMNTNPFGE